MTAQVSFEVDYQNSIGNTNGVQQHQQVYNSNPASAPVATAYPVGEQQYHHGKQPYQ
jgi:hypothetical protein